MKDLSDTAEGSFSFWNLPGMALTAYKMGFVSVFILIFTVRKQFFCIINVRKEGIFKKM